MMPKHALQRLDEFFNLNQFAEETVHARVYGRSACLHRRKETILLDDEEEEQDILEELADEEADDVSEIIWHEIHANAVRKAFDRLSRHPQTKSYTDTCARQENEWNPTEETEREVCMEDDSVLRL